MKKLTALALIVPSCLIPHSAWSRGLALLFVAAALLAMSPREGEAQTPPEPAADAAVITDWNATATATIVTDAGKGNAEAFLWYAFEQAAVYNAVVGITGRYQLYEWNVRGPQGASPEAAAATAAYRVLLTYFPASRGRLDTAYAASLAKIADGLAKQQGVAYGELAAARIIALRADDRRFAPLSFSMPVLPGVWVPTLPAFAAFFDPWLAQMKPLLLTTPSQFRPADPPALTSATYTQEFNEVKGLGSRTGSQRTPAQTQTALFFSDVYQAPLHAGLRDLVTRRRLDISDSARLFAAVDMSLADAIGVSWDSKLYFGYWRPVTAIRLADADGNPATAGDPNWEPLIATPPYPEYTSGANAVFGVVARVLTRVLGTDRIDLSITSTAAGTTRMYESAAQLKQDVIDARVWSGIHFRAADVVASEQGRLVADWALDHYFLPTQTTMASTVLTSSTGAVIGTATFVEGPDGTVLTSVTARNLTPGAHGLHIHAVGRCDQPDFLTAGAHFNPFNRLHGFRTSQGPHAGDLPNLIVGPDGTGTLVFADTVTNRFTLRPGTASILDADGSALIVHAGPDDEITDPTGDSGGRVACALIVAGTPASAPAAVRPPSTGDGGLVAAQP